MPYSDWDEVNDAITGIEPRVTLAQANLIAEWADAMAEQENGPENPWAAAIARFKELYEVEGDRWVKKEAEAAEFLFAEFAEGQPVEFLRIGTFIDAHGQEIEVTDAFLDALVANFEANQAGQDVPIDVNHARDEAAGWILRVWRDGDRLLAQVDWNDLGQRLVGERVYRYLSATIDMARKVLKSISLVNFPAVKGLRPVELSEGVYGVALQEGLLDRIVAAIRGVFKEADSDESDDEAEAGAGDGDGDVIVKDETEEDEMTEEELREQIRQEIAAELEEEQQTRAELREQVRQQVEAELREEMQRRADLREFAEEICGGEQGLSTEPEALVELMADLDEAQLEGFKTVLKAKVVDFRELGSSREGKGAKKALDAEMAAHLRKWVDAGEPIEAWFKVNADVVGSMDDYELSEFEPRK